MTHTLFISDLHLQANEPEIADIFFRFLKHQAPAAEALYILGDLFEVWVGDDDLTSFHLQVIQALQQATANGLPVYFMRGNRDFLIGKKFAQKTGVKLLPDPTLINLYGDPTLLMHGDSLCTFDIPHQKTRRITLNPYLQWLALRLPLSFRRRCGIYFRNKSQRHHQYVTSDIMDVNPGTVDEMMAAYQVKRLIHGHTHRPAIHSLNDARTRIVLGAWHHQGNALVCDDQQRYQLQMITKNSLANLICDRFTNFFSNCNCLGNNTKPA